MSDCLSGFLLARVAEDEAVARAAKGRAVYDERPEVKEWLGLANPDRMLMWSGVRRRLIELHVPDGPITANGPRCGACWQSAPCPTIRTLAVLYADHPDFQEAWRPDGVSIGAGLDHH